MSFAKIGMSLSDNKCLYLASWKTPIDRFYMESCLFKENAYIQKIMNNSFSFTDDKVFSFCIGLPNIQGHISRLNSHMARIYFTKTLTNTTLLVSQEIPMPVDIVVNDLTLKERAPSVPPNNNIILMWSSNYNVQYNGKTILCLTTKREYNCCAE